MKNLFRTLGVSFFLSACLLFGLSFFKIITVSNPITTSNNTSSQSATVSRSATQQVNQTTVSTTQSTVAQTTTTTRTQQGSSEKVSFTVSSDDTSYSVADRLLEQGIIKNVDEFNDYMLANDLGRYIQTGTFELRKNMTLKELGETLTTYPGN